MQYIFKTIVLSVDKTTTLQYQGVEIMDFNPKDYLGGLITIDHDLEISIHITFVDARQRGNISVSIEHLLLGILDNPSVQPVLTASGADVENVRNKLNEHIEFHHRPHLELSNQELANPTSEFVRVLMNATKWIPKHKIKQITGSEVLTAILGEKSSFATRLLISEGVSLNRVLMLIACGIGKNLEQK